MRILAALVVLLLSASTALAAPTEGRGGGGGGGGVGLSGLTTGAIPKALSPTTIGDSSLLDCGGGVIGIGACTGNAFTLSGTPTAPRAIYLPDANSSTVVAKDCNALNAGDVVKSISALGVVGCLTPAGGGITTTAPLTGTTTIGCATCVSAASALTVNNVLLGNSNRAAVVDAGLTFDPTNDILTIGVSGFELSVEVSPLTAGRTFHIPNANSNSVVPTDCTTASFMRSISAEGVIVCMTASHLSLSGTAPAISGSCGTSPAIAGTDFAGKVTTGAGSPTSCVLTFAVVYTNAPACFANDETTATLIKATTTTTTLTLAATITAGDVISYVCAGRL